jgi:hypothetical protein
VRTSTYGGCGPSGTWTTKQVAPVDSSRMARGRTVGIGATLSRAVSTTLSSRSSLASSVTSAWGRIPSVSIPTKSQPPPRLFANDATAKAPCLADHSLLYSTNRPSGTWPSTSPLRSAHPSSERSLLPNGLNAMCPSRT